MQVEHGRVAQHPRDSGARFLQQSPSPVRNCWRGATIFLTTQKPALCTISTDQNNPTMMASQSWHHNARPVLKSPSTLHSASLKHGATVRISETARSIQESATILPGRRRWEPLPWGRLRLRPWRRCCRGWTARQAVRDLVRDVRSRSHALPRAAALCLTLRLAGEDRACRGASDAAPIVEALPSCLLRALCLRPIHAIAVAARAHHMHAGVSLLRLAGSSLVPGRPVELQVSRGAGSELVEAALLPRR